MSLSHAADGAHDTGPATTPPRSPLRRFFGIASEYRAYLRVAYLLLSFPLGVAYFVLLVTFISTGAGLAITLVGIPLLIATVYGWCALGSVERVTANALLGTEIVPIRFPGETGPFWSTIRIKARLGNLLTWRILAWLFIRFPQSIGGLVLASAFLAWPATMLLSPILYRVPGSTSADSGMDFLFWDIDRFWESMVLVALSPLMFVAGLHIMSWYARLSGRLTALFLGGERTGGASESGDRFERGFSAAVRWPGVRLGRSLTEESARLQWTQTKLMLGHLVGALVIVLGLLFINGMTTPGTWWVIWPAWGFAIAF
ncbi:hypothetical protein AYO38_10185, partial [bacterium SCGC AG-212-C10]